MSAALASNLVVVGDAVVPATVVYSPRSGLVLAIVEGVVGPADPLLLPYDVKHYRDVSPLAILPGLVDAHVHLNEPGRTEWEGFASGTQAAASGGVTTVVDMPLNAIPPTTTVANFNRKLDAAEGQTWVDVAFWGGLVPGNLTELKPLVAAGVRGFKGFLMESGVDEFPMVDKSYIEQALVEVNGLSTILMFHAELDNDQENGCCTKNDNKDKADKADKADIDEKSQNSPLLGSACIDHSALAKADPRKYQTFLDSRPDSFETNAIAQIITCMDAQPKTKCHIVHLASQQALPEIEAAQARGLPLSVETCFHYLSLRAEDIPDGNTQFKCCPPIRSDSNRRALWEALRKGTITSVVSDHSPCTPELKGLERGDFMAAWGGISSVGFGLPLLWTRGRDLYGDKFSLADVAQYCCKATAKQIGLSHRKGAIAPGMDADFAIFDPSLAFTVANARTFFKNKLTAFDGERLTGRVVETILRGKSIYALGKGVSNVPMGSLILEPRLD